MTLPDIYKEHKLLKIDEIVRLEQLKLGYKLTNKLLPESITSHLSTGPDRMCLIKQHNYRTRTKGILNLPLVKNSAYRKSFLYQSLREFNMIQQKIRTKPTLNRFITACKQEILGEN